MPGIMEHLELAPLSWHFLEKQPDAAVQDCPEGTLEPAVDQDPAR